MDFKILDNEYLSSKYYQFYLYKKKINLSQTKEFLRNSNTTQEYRKLEIILNNEIYTFHKESFITTPKTFFYKSEKSMISFMIYENCITIVDDKNYWGFKIYQNIPFILDVATFNLGLIDEKEKINLCKILDKSIHKDHFTIFHKDFAYNLYKEQLMSIEKCDNQIQNTFIGFEDAFRNILQKNNIPLFWKLNYLPAYKKLKQTKKELFEKNVFKSIIEYI
jgi:hypothetical protein